MKVFCFLAVLFISFFHVYGQTISDDKIAEADSILKSRGELIISFYVPDTIDIGVISQTVSIDYRKGKFIRAYANQQQFKKFLNLGIDFSIEVLKKPVSVLKGAGAIPGTYYPTYDQYDSIMHAFQTNYPSLCQLHEIGKSVMGRSLYFLKISSDVDQHLDKPVVMYSSTMHGDEIVPYALMLHLIYYLLTNHSQTRIQMLLDSCELWICPLANPDGTYFGGNQTVFGSKRYNANNVDLNRNFPDPAEGEHPDGNAWQPENIAVMNFLKQHPPTLSANFHSGSEVVNYPWDTWSRGHADSTWYAFLSHEYADTVQHYSVPGFYTDVTSSGITDGYAWYRITGGRQDYVNYYMHGREVTIEVDEQKLAPESDLAMYWNDHYRSLINYLYRSFYGFRGRITDKITGNPLKAEVEMVGHDFDNSYIYSDSTNGMYYRMTTPGRYRIRVSADGYLTKDTIGYLPNSFSKDRIDIQLQPVKVDTSKVTLLLVYPNPASKDLFIKSSYFNGNTNISITITNATGRSVYAKDFEAPVDLIDLQISQLSRGVYFTHVRALGLDKTMTFIKM